MLKEFSNFITQNSDRRGVANLQKIDKFWAHPRFTCCLFFSLVYVKKPQDKNLEFQRVAVEKVKFLLTPD
jgi:hypothetical protein